MQIDKLVQLLESPIFLHLRLQLLDVEAPYHVALLKSCYGILMLLPGSIQSDDKENMHETEKPTEHKNDDTSEGIDAINPQWDEVCEVKDALNDSKNKNTEATVEEREPKSTS